METDKSIDLEKRILQHVQDPNFKDMNRVRPNEFNVFCRGASLEATVGTWHCITHVAVELEIRHDFQGRNSVQ